MLLELTAPQRDALLKCFGPAFVDALPARLAQYGAQWGLRDFTLIEYYSVNCLFLCQSARYGDCVLKIFGCEAQWYMDEIHALEALGGRRGYVGVYACDADNGALLLERIRPGTTLKQEPSLEKRAAVFARLWHGAHLVPPNPGQFRSYLQTARQAAEKPWHGGDNPLLRRAARRMVPVCRELYGRYPRRVLLHGDLHGDNLLKNPAGGYTIVDPHGRMGPPVCDVGRFVANEFDDAPMARREDVTRAVVARLSRLLHLPQADIVRAFFVDMTLMTCWDAEDGPIKPEGVLFAGALLDAYTL